MTLNINSKYCNAVVRFLFFSLLIGLCYGPILFPIDVTAATVTMQMYGQITFTDQTDANPQSVKRVEVKIYDEDTDIFDFIDDLLATTRTDNAGEIIGGGITTDEFDSLQGEGPDIYYKIYLDNDVVVISEEWNPFTISYQTPTHNNVMTSSRFDVALDNATGLNDSANILSVITDTHDWLNWGSMDKYTVEQHADAGGAYFEPPILWIFGNQIHIKDDRKWNNTTIGHEYGHAVMWVAYQQSISGGGSHAIYSVKDPGFAMSEGWAEYFSEMSPVPGTSYWWINNNDYWKGDADSSFSRIDENGTNNSGEVVEAAIATVLYSLPFNEVWPIIRDNKPANIKEFWDEYMNNQPNIPQRQSFRQTCETNGVVYSRGKLMGIDKDPDDGSDNFVAFSDGDSIPGKVKFSVDTLIAGDLHVETSMENVTAVRLQILTAQLPAIDTDSFINDRLYSSGLWRTFATDSDVSDGIQGTLDIDGLGIDPGFYAIRVQVQDENQTWDTFYPDLGAADGSGMITSEWLTSLHTLHKFRIAPFTARCTPPSRLIRDGDSKPHYITIKNLHDSEDADFHVELKNGWPPGWTVNPTSFNENISAGDEETLTFHVSNSGAVDPISILVEVTAWGITKTPENLVNPENPGHVTDRPDDNYSVSHPNYPTPWLYDSESEIGVLSTGWGEGLNYLLGKYKTATTVVKRDFSILNEPTRSLNDVSVLLVGSAGFEGLDSSATFRKQLEDYVSQGGVLITFTAKRGYEFQALPGGQVRGYGWDEDQSCQYRSVYIDTYHQMLSGQTSSQPSVNVDGYFTKWPSDATILLGRTKNGMPAMIMYPYGEGLVIALTAYSDWGYGHNQTMTDEQILVRDIVAWAMEPKELPEFSPGDDVEFSFDVANNSGTDAAQIKLATLDPNKNPIEEETITQAVAAGGTESVNYLHPSVSRILGIWYVNYTLLDDGGNPIQDELLGERFVVSDPVEVAVKKDIAFAVTSPSEYYARGSDAVFTVHIWNNGDTDRTITSKVYVLRSSFTDERAVPVPANGEASFNLTLANVNMYRIDLFANFYDESGKGLGGAQKVAFVYSPSVDVTVKTDKSMYRPGGEVNLSLDLRNKQSQDYTCTVNIIVLDPDNVKVFETSPEVSLLANAISHEDINFTLPADAEGGAYIVQVEAVKNGKIGSDSTYFQVPEAYIAITPNIPGVLQSGTNTLSFDLDPINLAGIPTGTLEIGIIDPNGTTIWTDSKDFDIIEGETSTVDFDAPTDGLLFGKYKLTYKVTYGAKTVTGEREISCSSLIAVSFDKGSYRIRETIRMDIDITNDGQFLIENAALNVSIPDIDYSYDDALTLSPNQSTSFSPSTLIPETLSAGTYQGSVTLTLNNSTVKTFEFTIPESELALSLDETDYHAGDWVRIGIEDVGGVDTTAEYTINLADKNGVSIFDSSSTIDLLASVPRTIDFIIPQNVVNGEYHLSVEAQDLSTSEFVNLTKVLQVIGLMAALEVDTDKQIYRSTDPRTAISDIHVSQGTIENGTLNLQAIHLMDQQKIWTTQEDWESGELHRVDTTSQPGDVIVEGFAGAGAASIPRVTDIPRSGEPDDLDIDQTIFEPEPPPDLPDEPVLPPEEPEEPDPGGGTLNSYGDYLRIGIDHYGHLGDYSNRWGFGYDNSGTGSSFHEVLAIGWWGDGYVVGYDSSYAYSYEGDGNYNLAFISEDITEDAAQARVIDITESGKLKITQDFTLDKKEKYLKLDVTLTNTGTTDLNNVSYVRVADWDVYPYWDYWDYLMDSDSLPIVMAHASGRYFGLAASNATPNDSFDCDAWNDLHSPNVLDNYDANGYNDDGCAGLGWTVGTLAPGTSYNLTLYYLAGDSKEDLIETYNRADAASWLTLKFDVGRQVEWKTISWDSDEPTGTRIRVATRTAESEEGLEAAGWSGYYAAPGAMITSDANRWIEVKAALQTLNPVTLTPVLHELSIDYLIKDSVWEQDIPVEVTDTLNVLTPLEPIEGKGKFLLMGTLYSQLSQVIDTDSDTFYIDDGDIHLTFDMDKAVYKPTETITIAGEVVNDGSLPAEGLHLVFQKAGGAVLYEDTIDVPAGGSYSYSFDIPASGESFILDGSLDGINVSEQIEIEAPRLDVVFDHPLVVGRPPFNFGVTLINPTRVDVNITLNIEGDAQDLTIPPGTTRIMQKTFSIIDDTTIDVILSGEVGGDYHRDIQFGEAAVITIAPEAIYPEGSIAIPYTVENTGSLDTQFDLDFTLDSKVETKSIFVPVGGTFSDTLHYDLTAGEYNLSYDSFFGSDSANFKVARFNHLDMSLSMDVGSTPSVLILKDGGTEGDFNTVLTGAGMNVTVSTVYEYQWNGTNPSAADFDVVVLLNGFSYTSNMPNSGQTALVDYVNAGGGLIITEWTTYENRYYNYYANMTDLLLFESNQWNYSSGAGTFTVVQEHPVTAGLPTSFSAPSHAGNRGGVKPGVDVLMTGTVLNDLVAVKEHGEGRIVQFAIAGNYSGRPFTTPEMQTLLTNAATWSAGASEDELVAKVGVNNLGYNEFSGQLRIDSDFYSELEDLTLAVGEINTIRYNIDLSQVKPGIYDFIAAALYEGNVVQQVGTTIEVPGAEFELTSKPENPIYIPGEEVTMSFKVKNTGRAEGEAEVHLTVIDLLDETRMVWINPGVEEEINFTFVIPDDLPEKAYTAPFQLNGVTTEIPFTVKGVKIDVSASLDKPIYNLGDTAVLTLEITNEGDLYPEMYARVRPDDDEEIQEFTLSDSNTLQFNIPIDESTQEYTSYGIYLASGRGVYLNTIYIRLSGDILSLYTDKGVYMQGELVTAFVDTSNSGMLSVTGPGLAEDIDITGPTSFDFVLPGEMASGTYSIYWEFVESSGVYNFDVVGYSARFLECTLDKETYNPIDEVNINFKIEVNQDISGLLRGWLLDPAGNYSDLFEVSEALVAGENQVQVSAPLSTAYARIHRVVYALYKNSPGLLLASGGESFDVNAVALTALSTLKPIYESDESVQAKVNAFASEAFSGDIQLSVDGNEIITEPISFSGYQELTYDLGIFDVGDHIVSAVLILDSDVISQQNASFTVIDTNPPTMPTGLSASVEGSTATLTWNANPEADLSGYHVYRNGARLTATPIAGTTYHDSGLVANTDYTYYVTAVDEVGNESEPSNSVALGVDSIPPVITLSPASDITSDEPVTMTYTVTDNVDTDPTVDANYPSPTTFGDNGVYTVNVSAEDSAGNTSSKSVTITIERKPPEQITTLEATDAAIGGTVDLDWTGYDETGQDVISYNIYQSESDFSNVTGMTPIASVPAGTFSYRVTDLTNGIQYYFAVTPVNSDALENPSVRTASAIPTVPGEISISSEPPGAEVYLGGNYGYLGEYKGETPTTIPNLPEGKYVVRLRMPGYENSYDLVEVTGGATTELPVTLVEAAMPQYTTGDTLKYTSGELLYPYTNAVAPFVVDWNMDGKKDILISDDTGEVWYYENVGTDDVPEFDTGVTVLSGLGPNITVFVVDWNNDSKKNLLIGDGAGSVIVYENTGTDSEPVFDGGTSVVNVDNFAIPSVVDWNNDQKKDLLVGDGNGYLNLFLNSSTDQSPTFGAAEQIMAGDIPLSVGTYAAPCVLDWDADGNKDLLIGCQTGEVYLCLNTGSDEAPTFTTATPIKAGDLDLSVGENSTLFVVDWNNNPIKDLLVGSGDGQVYLFLGEAAITDPLAGLEVVDAYIQQSVANIRFGRITGLFSLDLIIQNISETTLLATFIVVVTSISSPDVTVADADGETLDEMPYWDYSSLLVDEQLLPGESVLKRVAFNNPLGVRFRYTIQVFSKIGE